MSTQPTSPAPAETYQVEAGGTPRWIFLVLGVLVAGMIYLIYAQNVSRKTLEDEVARANARADLLARKIEQADSRIADLKGQMDLTSQKLGLTETELARAREIAQGVRKQQAATEQEFNAKLGQAQQENEAKLTKVSSEESGAKSDIEATRKDLEATKAKMERTVGDMNVMSGLIARNKEEVEELKRRGERNIFDFDVKKSNTALKVGPILMILKMVVA